MNKYNYIILGSEWDLYKFSYSDIFELPNVLYVAGTNPQPSSIRGILYRAHFNLSINRHINLPFKTVWNSSYFKNPFPNDSSLCFIVFNNWLTINVDIIPYLKKQFPDAHFVWMCQDLLQTEHLLYTQKPFDPWYFKSLFDLSISFDFGDCEKYGLIYHPLVISKFRGKIDDLPSSDVYFLGKAKDRLPLLLSVFERLSECGLVCDFNIAGVNENRRVNRPGIKYVDSMSYFDNIQHILHTKCLLEILQDHGRGYSQRTLEAIGFNRMLLTNNAEITNAPFYCADYISLLGNSVSIDSSFVDTIFAGEPVDYNYQDKVSPKELLCFICDKLS